MRPLCFDDCVTFLRARLTDPLPGTTAQLRLAPAYRMDPGKAQVEGKDCREAGVLALLYPRVDESGGDEPVLVLTVRRDTLPDHPGQISFPGGQREPGETLRQTALREAHEEVALDPGLVDVLGALTPLYIPPSGFCVHPFVGVTDRAPRLHPTDAEVGEILHVPLGHLLDPATRVTETWTLRGTRVEVPFYDVDGRTLWGATAMMLAELLALFDAA